MSPLRLIPILVLFAAPVAAAAPQRLADAACRAIADRVDAVPGTGPLFLASYEPAPGETLDPALSGAAFTYDNALAAMALAVCGRTREAARIGEALLAAATADRSGEAGRLRNAYRAGPLGERPVPPMGWWDGTRNLWLEDAYQVGSATGNLAWGGLALLTLEQATGDARFRDGATRIARWIDRTLADGRKTAGYAGGIQGHDRESRPLTWKSTEHNVDLAALFGRLDRTAGGWGESERRARAFVAAMWDAGEGRFLIGTRADGVTPERDLSGLDAELWPLLIPDADPAWRRAMAYAERAHGVPDGFDFNADRDGLWIEGTAQAALAYALLERRDDACRLLSTLKGQISPGGYLWASREASITTGLAVGPESTTDDFRYVRRPALAPTAWAVFAARRWNPLSGEFLPR